MSMHIIYDADGANPVIIDGDHAPIVSNIRYPNATARRQTLCSRSGGNINAGETHTYTAGSHISGATIVVDNIKINGTTLGNIATKLLTDKRGEIRYSPDGGTTRYRGVLAGGLSGFAAIPGTAWYVGSLEIELTGTV